MATDRVTMADLGNTADAIKAKMRELRVQHEHIYGKPDNGKRDICPVCQADRDVWREQMHEEHHCPGDSVVKLVNLIMDALIHFHLTECDRCAASFDIAGMVTERDIRKWLEEHGLRKAV